MTGGLVPLIQYKSWSEMFPLICRCRNLRGTELLTHFPHTHDLFGYPLLLFSFLPFFCCFRSSFILLFLSCFLPSPLYSFISVFISMASPYSCSLNLTWRVLSLYRLRYSRSPTNHICYSHYPLFTHYFLTHSQYLAGPASRPLGYTDYDVAMSSKTKPRR